MAVPDAQMYWISAKVPNDQFLVYAFDGVPGRVERALAEVVDRARSCAPLRLRVDESGSRLRFPAWVSADVDSEQVLVRGVGALDWQGCLDAVTRLADDQLELRRMAWRLHVFTGVSGAPGAAGPATVAVMQIGHALADGIRSGALAGALFGRAATISAVTPLPRRHLVWRSTQAATAQRRLERDTAAGVVPPQAGPRPVLTTNNRPAGARMVRTLVRPRARLAGPTVTVGVLAAISSALSDHLCARGEDASLLGAELPMAKDGVRHAHNHYRNVGVGLYPTVASTRERACRIAADLEDRRRRGTHPAFAASERAMAAVPAPLLRWGVAQFDVDARSTQVTGNTVVSSVNRGPADLRFGGCPVILTAGYPALSPMMGLTHGVHGIGDTVAISVHTAESVMPDFDDYVDRLDAALRI
jgi:WS/DGAT C-terminal domain